MIDDAALASLACSSAVRDVVRHVAAELVRLLDDGLVGVYRILSPAPEKSARRSLGADRHGFPAATPPLR